MSSLNPNVAIVNAPITNGSDKPSFTINIIPNDILPFFPYSLGSLELITKPCIPIYNFTLNSVLHSPPTVFKIGGFSILIISHPRNSAYSLLIKLSQPPESNCTSVSAVFPSLGSVIFPVNIIKHRFGSNLSSFLTSSSFCSYVLRCRHCCSSISPCSTVHCIHFLRL